MKIFGVEINSTADMDELREAVRELERQLEDIGWTRINQPGAESHLAAKESFQKMVRRCRLAYIKNPIVAQALNLTTSYTFGAGVSTPKSEDKEVQQIVGDFWKDKDNRVGFTAPKIQLELSNKLQYDGEIALLLQVDLDGAVYVRVMDPLSISGRLTNGFDLMRPLFYKRTDIKGGDQYIPDWENGAALMRDDLRVKPYWDAMLKALDIKEDKVLKNAYIYHLKVNCDPLDSRGIPEVYRALEWMNANTKINSDAATFISAQAQYAWKKKIEGTKGQINAMRARQAQNNTLTNPSAQAGSTYLSNAKVDMEAVEVKSGSGQLFEIGIRRTLLMMAAAFGIMEHYFGDPSTGNLATATAMELPMLKKFQARQTLWMGVYDDVLQFQLDAKLMALNIKSFDYSPIKNRIEVSKGRDYKNRNVDIDFPAILEKDVKMLTEALVAAKNGQLIPIDTARRISMQSFGVNNIEEEMKKEFAEPPAPVLPFGGGPNNPPADKKTQEPNPAKESKRRRAIMREAVSSVQSELGSERGQTIRVADSNKEILRKVNGYLSLIAGAFNSLIKESRDCFSFHHTNTGEVVLNEFGFKKCLRKFQESMLDAAAQYYPQVAKIGEAYSKSRIPVLETDGRRRLVETAIDSFIDEQISWNEDYVKKSLVPALSEKLDSLRRKKYSSPSGFFDDFKEAFSAMETRVGSYAGALWTVSQRAVKEASKGTNEKAVFIGVEDSSNCVGCAEAIDGNPWDVNNVPVPGEQDCLGKCRHAIQIQGDEALSESDIQVLRDAEKECRDGFKIIDQAIFESLKRQGDQNV